MIDAWGALLIEAPIPTNVALAEAARDGRPVRGGSRVGRRGRLLRGGRRDHRSLASGAERQGGSMSGGRS